MTSAIGDFGVGDGLAFLINDLALDDALGERGGRKHERHGERQDTPVQMGPHADPHFAEINDQKATKVPLTVALPVV